MRYKYKKRRNSNEGGSDLVHNHADGVASDIKDTTSAAMIIFEWHTTDISGVCLDVDIVSLPISGQVRGGAWQTVVTERPLQKITGAGPLAV